MDILSENLKNRQYVHTRISTTRIGRSSRHRKIIPQFICRQLPPRSAGLRRLCKKYGIYAHTGGRLRFTANRLRYVRPIYNQNGDKGSPTREYESLYVGRHGESRRKMYAIQTSESNLRPTDIYRNVFSKKRRITSSKSGFQAALSSYLIRAHVWHPHKAVSLRDSMCGVFPYILFCPHSCFIHRNQAFPPLYPFRTRS